MPKILAESGLKGLCSYANVPSGMLIANTFNRAPSFRLKDADAVYTDNGIVHHFKTVTEEEVYSQTFRDTNVEMLRALGFEITEYNDGKSLLLQYVKEA